ncbi:LapA family protein [Kitasatospora sp. GAS204B]|uniref:LapA family protein n=1 Tax=unclassified Kitasatospora TaxID=2633591 RepID=UPI0024744F3F|nr:LapA family protein [Kitasatospora sp. GAS204B]MDH6120302.1 putative integral membrane protein [Kitasatospora sp. GAS204B]
MTRNSERPFAGQKAKQSEIAGIPTRLIVGVVVAALALWFLLANLNNVKIQFWVFTVEAPLWIALAATLLIGAVLGYLLKGRRESR